MAVTSTRAFTLIELLVVIAIIGILSSVISVSLNTARAKARDTRRISDLKQLNTALQLYYLDHNAYPVCASEYIDAQSEYDSSTGAAGNCLRNALVPQYIPALMSDPRYGNDGAGTWGQDYNFYGDATKFQLRGALETNAIQPTGSYPGQPAGYCGVSASLPVCTYYQNCVYKGYGASCSTSIQYGPQG